MASTRLPEGWQTAIATPGHKKDFRRDPGNCRPGTLPANGSRV